jgi:hypothetical protein
MAITHTITRQYKDQSSVVSAQIESPTGNAESNLDQLVPIAANTQYHMAFTRANLQSLAFYSDQPIAIYTNNPSGAAPQDTIPLVAGQVKVWTLATDLLATCPFSANVTTLYITNASAAAANVRIRALLIQ